MQYCVNIFIHTLICAINIIYSAQVHRHCCSSVPHQLSAAPRMDSAMLTFIHVDTQRAYATNFITFSAVNSQTYLRSHDFTVYLIYAICGKKYGFVYITTRGLISFHKESECALWGIFVGISTTMANVVLYSTCVWISFSSTRGRYLHLWLTAQRHSCSRSWTMDYSQCWYFLHSFLRTLEGWWPSSASINSLITAPCLDWIVKCLVNMLWVMQRRLQR